MSAMRTRVVVLPVCIACNILPHSSPFVPLRASRSHAWPRASMCSWKLPRYAQVWVGYLQDTGIPFNFYDDAAQDVETRHQLWKALVRQWHPDKNPHMAISAGEAPTACSLVWKSTRELVQVCKHLNAWRRCSVVTCGSRSEVAWLV